MYKFIFPIVAIAASQSAMGATIDFESYADPTNAVTLTESGATFAGLGGTTGFEISAYGQPSWGTGAPKILCPRLTSNYCGGDFQVTFAGTASGLSFYFTGDDSATTLSVQGFLGATSLGTINVTSDGGTITSHFVDLTSLGGLDRIEVTGASADPAGFGYDDFSFSLGGVVPEPATWAMMIVGFGVIGASARSRRVRSALA